jgi:hypothetical protein
MRRRRRRGLERPHDHGFDPGVIDRARRARARFVAQPLEAPLDKPTAPFANRALVHPEMSGNLLVLLTFGAFKDDTCPQRQRLRRASPRRQRSQLRLLCLRQNQSCKSSSRHRSPPKGPASDESDTAAQIGNTVNFRFGTIAGVQDTVDITLQGSPNLPDHHWRIPKNYLAVCVTCFDQWHGDVQSFFVVRAGIYWSSSEIKPWPDPKLSHTQVPTPDVGLTITVKAISESFENKFWHDVISPNLEQKTEALDDLIHYKQKKSSHLGEDVLTPTSPSTPGTVYFLCFQNTDGRRTGCTGHAYLGDEIGFQYSFNAGGLIRWREIETKTRALLNTFRLD